MALARSQSGGLASMALTRSRLFYQMVRSEAAIRASGHSK